MPTTTTMTKIEEENGIRDGEGRNKTVYSNCNKFSFVSTNVRIGGASDSANIANGRSTKKNDDTYFTPVNSY